MLLVVLALLISGCATVDPKPFGEFSLAVQGFRDGTDAALSTNSELNRERFINRTAQKSMEGENVRGALKIQDVDTDPFGWTMEEIPLFMESERFRKGVYNLNTTLVTYADLLKSLAATELVSEDQFNDMAKNMDAGLAAAAEQLKFTNMDKGLAMFSTLAAKSAYAYIENKRSVELQQTMKENQANIDDLANRLQVAIETAKDNLTVDYDSRFGWLVARMSSKDKLDAREKLVAQFMALNEEYVKRLDTLRELNAYCSKLPSAHRELIQSIKSPKMKLSAINDLIKSGQKLQKLYKELAKN
jgi:hypothetical protein